MPAPPANDAGQARPSMAGGDDAPLSGVKRVSVESAASASHAPFDGKVERWLQSGSGFGYVVASVCTVLPSVIAVG
jgi:hypothetical protein